MNTLFGHPETATPRERKLRGPDPLHQFFTPEWAAGELVDQFFAYSPAFTGSRSR